MVNRTDEGDARQVRAGRDGEAAAEVLMVPASAIPRFEQRLVSLERLRGPDDPATLTAQNNLAASYQDAGRLAEAILLFRLTLAARERVLGAYHPDTATSRNNLARAYREAGRATEAIPLVQQILAIREGQLGPDHSSTLAARNNLAAAYRAAAGQPRRFPCSSRTWPHASSCWAPSTPGPWPPAATSPTRSRRPPGALSGSGRWRSPG